MSFDAFPFWAFLLLVWVAYLLLRANNARKALLLAASYLFYASWQPVYLLFLAGATAVSYVIGSAVRDRRRRSLLITGVSTCVATLMLVKGCLTPLPVGISFYLLQAIAYMVDCYRGQLETPSGPFDFALYMSFFPRLTAGPIVRADDFLPQLAKSVRINSQMIWEALVLITFGLFKKLVIADNLALAVDPVFANPHVSGSRLILAAYAYALQIYCDFSGYTDVARGIARLFGYQLPLNFNWPYLATGPADFWRRWHISLSNWLRDYVYFSLPGLRSKSRAPAYANLCITMLICGLWHGARWTFALWGLYHGILLAIDHALTSRRPRARRSWIAALLTQQLVVLGWILFRSQRLADVPAYFANLAANPFYAGFSPAEWMAIALLLAAVLLHLIESWRSVTKPVLNAHWNPWVLIVLFLAAFAMVVLGVPTQSMFLYFRF